MVKTALITGGAQRVGKSFGSFLAAEGWSLVIHANKSLDIAESLAEELKSKYPDQEFNAIQCDLTNWKQVKDFGQMAIDRFGPIHLLINNASKYTQGKLLDLEGDVLEQMTAIHYFSPLMLSNCIAQQEIDALVVNILDAAIVNNYTEHCAYLLAKKSLAELTKMSACEYAPKTRVNSIAPGPVLPVKGKSQDVFNAVVDKTPLKKEVALSSMNSSLKYLIDNKNITGQILFCDSGQHLTGVSHYFD